MREPLQRLSAAHRASSSPAVRRVSLVGAQDAGKKKLGPVLGLGTSAQSWRRCQRSGITSRGDPPLPRQNAQVWDTIYHYQYSTVWYLNCPGRSILSSLPLLQGAQLRDSDTSAVVQPASCFTKHGTRPVLCTGSSLLGRVISIHRWLARPSYMVRRNHLVRRLLATAIVVLFFRGNRKL